MSNVQFQSKDWNPFTAAAGLLDKLVPDPEKEKHYSNAMANQSHTEQTVLARQTKPTPLPTGAPVPGTLKKSTAINPITGANVPRVPVKPKGAKPTAPGTRPKKK
jgi:hypothetical protein